MFFALWLPDLGGLTTVAVIAAAGAIGAVQGLAHVVLRIPSFIVTLGGMSIFSAIALVVSDAGPIRVIDREATNWLTCTSAASCRWRSSSPSSWWRCSPSSSR